MKENPKNEDNRSRLGQFQPTDYTGVRFGHYVMLESTGEKAKDGGVLWKAKCDCGKEFLISSYRASIRRSCGCKLAKNSGRYSPDDITGLIDRDIKAVEMTGGRDSNGYVIYKTKCMLCGKEYARYAESARNRSFDFELSFEQSEKITKENCYYCGAVPRQMRMFGTKSSIGFKRNGIDRVDNSKGYTIENCVPCCSECNFAKGSMDKDDFLNLVSRIYRHSLERR